MVCVELSSIHTTFDDNLNDAILHAIFGDGCAAAVLGGRSARNAPKGAFAIVDDHRSNKIVVELTGRLNKCGVISPRFDIQVADIEEWISKLLPSRAFGHIVLTTSYGAL